MPWKFGPETPHKPDRATEVRCECLGNSDQKHRMEFSTEDVKGCEYLENSDQKHQKALLMMSPSSCEYLGNSDQKHQEYIKTLVRECCEYLGNSDQKHPIRTIVMSKILGSMAIACQLFCFILSLLFSEPLLAWSSTIGQSTDFTSRSQYVKTYTKFNFVLY